MFKFIGAVVVGLVTMSAAAYFIMRPKEDRATDIDVAKSLFTTVVEGVKNYFHTLFNPAPTSEVA